MDNRLRLKVTIDSTKWLTLQTCPLRGGDEGPTSINLGNYLELVKLIASYNPNVARVLENAPKNAKYSSPDIQKELLQMFAIKVHSVVLYDIFLDGLLASKSSDKNPTYRDVIQSRKKKDDVIVEHHYWVDVFIVAIDSHLQELNNRFNDSVSELLRLSVTLDPRKSFNADGIGKLVTKYYPLDFTEQERIEFKLELQHYELDNDPRLKNISSLSELCRGLQITEKSEMYPLIDRLVRLILTLPVSTATSKRAFSKMKLVKTRLRSTMSDDF
ncbi:zinc finger MYM-type protein 1-like protein [Tanacetum coccineum]